MAQSDRATQIHDILQPIGFGDDSPELIPWIQKFEEIYRAEGVLADGRALSLQRSCPQRDDCWKSAQQYLREPWETEDGGGVNGSIAWPWVGTDYKPGGLCVLTHNINHFDDRSWSIGVEYAIASRAREAFEKGSKRVGRSLFFWNMVSSVGAVIAAMDGKAPTFYPDGVNESAMRPLARAARVQSVKCSPDRQRSKPTSAMNSNCPNLFAAREIDVLEPIVILAMGRPALECVKALSPQEISWDELPYPKGYERGTVMLSGRLTEVLWTYHPSAPGRWLTSQEHLVKDLEASTLRSLG
jgi:hypothetical protein